MFRYDIWKTAYPPEWDEEELTDEETAELVGCAQDHANRDDELTEEQ